MTKLQGIDAGIVFRNPMPHLASRHAYFPTAVELPSGELFVAFDVGSAFEAIDVRSFCCRSSDDGQTWTTPRQIFQPDEGANAVSTTCRVGAVDNGEFLAWACLFDRSRQDEGLGNPRTNGFCQTDFVSLRSRDGGQTWSPASAVNLPTPWRHFETCAPPFHIGDGQLLVATSAWPDWDGHTGPWDHDGLAFVSQDNGYNWSAITRTIRYGESPLTAFEQALTRLSDGRILTICWAYDREQQRNARNHIAFSADGEAFGEPQPTPLLGETARPLGLDSNRLLVVYRRADKPGLWAQLVLIEGDRWKIMDDLLLWNGAPNSQSSTGQGTIESLSKLRFGCPAVLQRRDGDAFVVFWCVEDCVSVIRWLRLRIAG